MDKLEKYILQNREEFDLAEPSPDVWEKIHKREGNEKVIKVNWKKHLMRAAAVILIIGTTYFIQEFRYNSENKNVETAQIDENLIIPELKEVEDYYNTEVNRKMKEISKLANYNSEIQMHLENDMAELDSVYSDLKNDLKENIDNEEVIAAMIQNYKIKMEILEDLLYFLQDKNNDKIKKAKQYEL